MSTANATTPQPRKLDADTVRKRLQDADAFCRQLGLIAPTATRKVRHNVKCPWCGGTMSVWVARENVVGSCKGACPTTHNPFAIIGKVRGLASRGEDFLRILEIGDAIAGGAATTLPTAPTTPQRTPAAAPVPPKAEPTTPQTQEDAEEDDGPITCKLHPEATPTEWAWVAGLGVDPHAVRDRDWLRVIAPVVQTDPAYKKLRDAGYTILLDGAIAVDPSTGISKSVYKDALVLSEAARCVRNVGPHSLDAWPKAQRARPEFYVCLGGRSFVVAEPHLQRRFLPLAAVMGDGMPAEVLAEIPTAATIVMLTDNQNPAWLYERLVRNLAAAGRLVATRPVESILPAPTPTIEIVDHSAYGPSDDTLRSMGALN